MTRTDKPLDLEEIADELIRAEYKGHYEKLKTIEQLKGSIISRKFEIKQILGQYIKSATQGLLQEIDDKIYKIEEDMVWAREMHDVYLGRTAGLEETKKLIKKWFPNMIENE